MFRRLLFLLPFLMLGIGASGQDLISTEYKGQRTKEFMVANFGIFIQNGIDLWKVTYSTPDVFGQLDTASGLLVVPQREQDFAYPLCVYQHGTVDGPDDVPSNLMGGWQLAAVMGGMGYVTLAPDFLGAGESRGFHPYVHADSEASAAADMVRAFRAEAPEMDITLNDQLFVTGYSQGGHASMAFHKLVEDELSAEMPLTAASHMSGPYDISGVQRELILSDEEYFTPAYLPNVYLSYNYVYGIYDSTVQMFKPEFVNGIDSFFNNQVGLFTLNSQLITQLTASFGGSVTKNMLQDSIVAILEDPSLDHPLHQALRDNDLYDWTPTVPMRMMYCTADDQVNFRNSVVTDSIMRARGATDVFAIDVNSAADHGGCVTPAVFQTIQFFAAYATFVVDIDEPVQAQEVARFSPNPVSNRTNILGLSIDTDFQVFSSSGRLMQGGKWTAGQAELDVSGWPAGSYFVLMTNAQGQQSQQLIVK